MVWACLTLWLPRKLIVGPSSVNHHLMLATTELPYEIWLHILRFLDTEATRQLRFLNTVLYNIWLDNYHTITQIGYPSNLGSHAPLRCVKSGIILDVAHSNSLWPIGIQETPDEWGCCWYGPGLFTLRRMNHQKHWDQYPHFGSCQGNSVEYTTAPLLDCWMPCQVWKISPH